MRLEAARADAARSRDALREVMADAKQASAATLLMERTQNDMLRLEERATAAEAALANEQRLHSDTRTKLSALEDEAEALRQKRAAEDTQAEQEAERRRRAASERDAELSERERAIRQARRELEEDIWEVERTELDFTMTLLKGETMAFYKRTQDHITRTIAQCNRLDGALRCFKEAHTFIKRVLLEIDPKHEHQVRVHDIASLVTCALPDL